MNDSKEEYILYRISKSDESLRDAKYLAENASWNACINRLYYACYYIVSALMLKNQVPFKTHSGLKTQFNKNFIVTAKVSKDNGKLYGDLMDWRHKGDYGDMFDFEQQTVEPLIGHVEDFILAIKAIIQE